MADDVARTSLTFDATGAKQGATDFQQAGQQVIAANAAVEASENKTAATTEAAATRKSTARRAASQSAKDTAAIETAALTAAGDASVVASNRIVTSYSSQQKALDNYAKSLDPFQANVTKAAKTVANLQDIQAQGGASAARATELLVPAQAKLAAAQTAAATASDAQGKSMKATTEASGQMGFAVRQLGVQTVQFFSSVQGGQSVLTALIQQGHQVADVALSTGTGMGVLGTAAKAAFGFITSPVGLVIAAAATLTALGVAAESTARRIEVMRNSLALARPDFIATSQVAEAAAKDLARTTFLDTSQARGGVSGVFQALPNYSGTQQQLESIVLVMARVSKAVHDGTVEWSDLSAVLKSPSAYLETLGGRLGALDPLFTRHIRDLEAAGQGYKATAEVLALLNDRTKTQADNMTPLEKALHDLSVSLTGASQGGKSFADTLGGPINNTLATLITGVNSLVTALKALEQIKPGAGLQALAAVFSGFAGGAAVAGAVSDKIIGALNIPQNGYLGSASNAVNSAIGWTPSRGPASSYAGIGAPASITAPAYDVSQMLVIVEKFVTSGMKLDDAVAYAANAMRESGGNYQSVNPGDAPGGSHGLFQWNRDRVTNFQSQNQGALPEQTSMDAQIAFANWERSHGYAGVDASVQGKTDVGAKAATVTAGYEVPKDIPGQSAISAAIANDFMARFSGGGGSAGTSGGGGASGGFGITAAAGASDSAEKLDKLRTSLGLVTDATTKYKGEQGLLEAALAAHPGDAGYAEALQKVQLALYDSVPAVTGQVRAIELDIAANNRLTTAWGENSKAASETTIQNKALTDALKIADPSTTQYAAAVAILTSELTKQAAAQERVQLAQASSVSRDNLTYLQAEISTLGMNYNARELLLTNLKNEQDLKRQYPNLSDAEIAARVKELGAVEQMTLALNQQKAGVDAIAGAFSQSFDTIGNAMAQAFVQGQGAAVNWQNVMASVIQQVIQQFAKLALLNPAMNFLFGQNNPTIDSTVQGLANGSGALSGLFKFLGGAGSSGADAISLGSSAINASGVGAFGIDSVAASILHDGGVASIGGEPRWVHAAYFDNAPRFHSGLGNDEVAAILQRGERVLTIAQTQNFDRMVKALPRFHDGMNNDGIGDMIDNFASTFAGGSSNQSSKDGQDGGDVHFHNNFNFGSAPANVDTFNRSATQIARKIGVTVRQEMGRGRN